METKKYYVPTILENGMIELLVQTAYIKPDGKELTRENWRTTIEPGDYIEVEKLNLDEYHLNIIRAAWTNEVVELYQIAQKQKNESEQTTEESGF